MLCPICNGDRDKDISVTKQKVNEVEIISEHTNPGGRELVIKGKGRVMLSDECNACDEQKLLVIIETDLR